MFLLYSHTALCTIWQRKHKWVGYVIRNDVLLPGIIEGRMKAKHVEEKGYIC